MSERECDYCGGQGWYGEPEHGPGCTSDKCEQPCPVELRVECPSCWGSGVREVPTVTEREQAAGTDGTESRVAPGQRQHGTAVPGRSPSRSVTAEPCTGYPDCTAVRHTHGCYADEGNCDHPDEHKESDGGASGRERPVGSETEGDGTTPASPPPGAASAQQLADRVRDALNDLYHYTADAVGGIPRRLAPGRSQMHEEGVKALAALVARVEQAERERDGCAFGCGPYPKNGAMAGEYVAIVPACPTHGWVRDLLDGADEAVDEAVARAERAEQALRKIVACDYRGNMPSEQAIARAALASAPQEMGGCSRTTPGVCTCTPFFFDYDCKRFGRCMGAALASAPQETEQ